jgi:hypothetical protein
VYALLGPVRHILFILESMDLSICEELHLLLPTPNLGSGEISSCSRANSHDEAAVLQQLPAANPVPPMLKRRLSGTNLTCSPDAVCHEWKVFSKNFDELEVLNASVVTKTSPKHGMQNTSLTRRNSMPMLFEIKEDKPTKTFQDAFHEDVAIKSVLSPASWNKTRQLSFGTTPIPNIMEEEPER